MDRRRPFAFRTPALSPTPAPAPALAARHPPPTPPARLRTPPPSGTTRDLLIAQRGPGELCGEMALFSKGLQRSATVRCATKVVARVITHEQLVRSELAGAGGRHAVPCLKPPWSAPFGA